MSREIKVIGKTYRPRKPDAPVTRTRDPGFTTGIVSASIETELRVELQSMMLNVDQRRSRLLTQSSPRVGGSGMNGFMPTIEEHLLRVEWSSLTDTELWYPHYAGAHAHVGHGANVRGGCGAYHQLHISSRQVDRLRWPLCERGTSQVAASMHSSCTRYSVVTSLRPAPKCGVQPAGLGQHRDRDRDRDS